MFRKTSNNGFKLYSDLPLIEKKKKEGKGRNKNKEGLENMK